MTKSAFSTKGLVGACACGLAALSWAAPFSVKYADTVGASGLPAEILVNQQAIVELILDNGNSSATNQSWSASHLKCIIFTFNNAHDKWVAINYSGSPLSANAETAVIGTFATNGSGQLQSGTFDWEDFRTPFNTPNSSNLSGSPAVGAWFIDHFNSVLSLGSAPPKNVDFLNVTHDDQTANWSNPVSSTGTCAGPSTPPITPPPIVSAAVSVPTLSEWGLVALSLLVTLIALVRRSGLSSIGRRRNR
jgi:hypothetical protein